MIPPVNRRAALEQILQSRPSRPLRNGEHILLGHALRCTCIRCGRLIRDWDQDGMLLVSECCQQRYTLRTQSVMVGVEDVSDQRLIANARDSEFPPDVTLKLSSGCDGSDVPTS